MNTTELATELATFKVDPTVFSKTTQKGLLFIDPRCIKIDLTINNRENYELEDLKLYIRERGVTFDPVVVYKIEKDPVYKYGLIQGFRRTLSCLELINGDNPINIPSIPAVIKDKPSTEEMVFMNLASNNGSPLTIIETAKAYKKLENFKWTATQIAKQLGKSISHVCQYLTIAEAPMALHNLINQERITPTLVRQVIDEHGADKAVTIIENLIKSIDNLEDKALNDSNDSNEVVNPIDFQLPNECDNTIETDTVETEKPTKGLNIRMPDLKNVVIKKNKQGKRKITTSLLQQTGALKSAHVEFCQTLRILSEKTGNLLFEMDDICKIISSYETNNSANEMFTDILNYYNSKVIS